MGTNAQFASVNASELIDQKNSDIFEMVFKTTQAAIFLVEVTDHNKFVFITSNESHQQKTGIASLDLAGKTPEELLGKELGSSISANYAKCLNEAKTIIYEEESSLPGGKRFWETSLTPVFENGKIVNIIGSSIDITERVNTQKSKQNAINEFAASETKYRGLFESSRDGIVYGNKDGYISQANPAFTSMLGYEHARELQGRHWTEITPEKWHSFEQKKVSSKVFIDGYSGEYEKEYIKKDGSVFPVVMQTWLTQHKDGTPDGLWAIARDISMEKAAQADCKIQQKKILASEKKYRTLLNASPEAVLLVNKEGSITEASDIAPDVFGKSGKDQLLGESLYSLVPDEKCMEMEEILQRAYQDEIIKDHQFVFKRNSHSCFIGEISVKMVSKELQYFKIFMIIIRDITDRKLIEQKMLRTERMASLGEMASVFAHEINQPLSIVSMIVDKVSFKNADNKLSSDYLGKKCHDILENIHKIDSIIGQIRMFAGEKDIDEFKNIDLNEIIQKLLGFIQTQYKKYHIHFKLNLQDPLPPVYSSKLKIEQILVNLLSNASFALNEKAKYKQTDGFKKEISIRTYTINNRICLEVEDNGTGISNDIKHQLFDPFFTTKGPESGTGLGLFIIDRTLKEMKGSIELESHINEYTRFKLHFPASRHKL
jgi:PAS domain S-box-containing protein